MIANRSQPAWGPIEAPSAARIVGEREPLGLCHAFVSVRIEAKTKSV
jgi:hypothetical protein